MPVWTLRLCISRHLAALAAMARYYARGCVKGARQGYRTARREPAEHVPPHAVDGLLAAYRKEGFKLAATSRSVELPERALAARHSLPSSEARPARWTGRAPAPARLDSVSVTAGAYAARAKNLHVRVRGPRACRAG